MDVVEALGVLRGRVEHLDGAQFEVVVAVHVEDGEEDSKVADALQFDT